MLDAFKLLVGSRQHIFIQFFYQKTLVLSIFRFVYRKMTYVIRRLYINSRLSNFISSHTNSRFSTLIQTLACQLSSTLIQTLTQLSSTLIQTLACQLSSTLIQTLACQLSSTLIQTLACQLSYKLSLLSSHHLYKLFPHLYDVFTCTM